ncbi:flagellar hook-basal body protein [Paenibacillus antri]|uniref:Flagellar hook-basal body protein n=1 Tax=Paenibacillus antri TaxID=2582848 RepID=A0A5R9GBN8_9BACL|nr:flagellar hook-basal body protein [Paenibacillus antri]TLS50544.1 flagellar hook-basal body protein [Paenibacillus antri]
MNHSMINAFVSMQSMQQKLDVIAHNIANVNTTGYKRREASFQDILTNVYRQPAGFEQAGRLTPLGFPQGWGAKIGQIELAMEQAALHSTGNPYDLGIEGNGLFEVQRNSVDANGEPVIAWTRDGSFQLMQDPANPGSMILATQQGDRVRGVDGGPIVVPTNYSIRIDEAGRVFATDHSNPEAEPIEAGQLALMRAVRPQVLINDGSNLFTLPPGVAAEGVLERVDPTTNDANERQKVAVRQGFLEQSNVSLTDEMTELMTVQRAYQLNARAITSSDTLMNLTNNLRV